MLYEVITGGLGCPVAMYLAVAGVGHLVIVDMDVVDLSNLNRQILHWDEDVDNYKVRSASAKLTAINPSIKVTALREKIDEENYLDLTRGCDVITSYSIHYTKLYDFYRFFYSLNLFRGKAALFGKFYCCPCSVYGQFCIGKCQEPVWFKTCSAHGIQPGSIGLSDNDADPGN